MNHALYIYIFKSQLTVGLGQFAGQRWESLSPPQAFGRETHPESDLPGFRPAGGLEGLWKTRENVKPPIAIAWLMIWVFSIKEHMKTRKLCVGVSHGLPPFSDHGSPWKSRKIDGLMSFSNLFCGQWEHPDLSIFAIFSCFEIWLHQRMLDEKLLRTWVRQLITMERVSSIAAHGLGMSWDIPNHDSKGESDACIMIIMRVALWPRAPLLGLRPDFRHHSRQDQECGSGFNTTRLEEDRVGESRTELLYGLGMLGSTFTTLKTEEHHCWKPLLTYWLQFQPTWRAFLFFLGDVTWPFDGREMITPCLTRCWPVENLLLLPPTHPPEGTRFFCFDGGSISKTAPLGCGVLVRLWQPTRIRSWRSHWCVMATPLRMTNCWSTLKRFGRRSKGKSCRSMASAWKMCSKPMFLGNGSASIWLILIWYWYNLRIIFGTIRYISRAWLHCVQLYIYNII